MGGPAADATAFDWGSFVDTYWNKKPRVFRSEIDQPIITTHELFKIMLRGAESQRENYEDTISMWKNNVSFSSDERLLPDESDLTLEAYIARATEHDQDNEFTFAQYNLHAHDANLWYSVRDFVHGLLSIVGVPLDQVDTDTFLGRYRSTPRGIHTDQASTFMHVIHGRKRMVVWPPDFFSDDDVHIVGSGLRKTIVNFDHAAVLGQGMHLEGGPGDVLFWPASFWHLSVADDLADFTAILNVGVYCGEPSQSLLAGIVQKVLQRALADYEHSWSDSIDGLPRVEVDGLNRFRRLMNSAVIDDLMADAWIKHVSAVGFRRTPPPLEGVALSEESIVQGDGRFPIISRPTKSGTKLFANGLVVEVPNDCRANELAGLLNQGSPQTVETVKRFLSIQGVPPAQMPTIHNLLENLVAARAISKCSMVGDAPGLG